MHCPVYCSFSRHNMDKAQNKSMMHLANVLIDIWVLNVVYNHHMYIKITPLLSDKSTWFGGCCIMAILNKKWHGTTQTFLFLSGCPSMACGCCQILNWARCHGQPRWQLWPDTFTCSRGCGLSRNGELSHHCERWVGFMLCLILSYNVQSGFCFNIFQYSIVLYGTEIRLWNSSHFVQAIMC